MSRSQDYGCFPFICDRLKIIFPFLQKNKMQENERHRGRLSPTPTTTVSCRNASIRKVSKTRKVSTSLNDEWTKKNTMYIRKTRTSSLPSNFLQNSPTSTTASASARNRSSSLEDNLTSRSRKTSTTYSKKLNYAVDLDENCQPKYSPSISATSNNSSSIPPKKSPRARSESRELHDVVSMATINEQQTSGSNNGKSKMNRLRWKRALSAVKDKKYRSDQDEN